MIKRVFLFFLCILLLLSLTGCWDYTEYNNLAQIVAIGIDYNKDTSETILSLQFIPTAKAQKSGEGEQSGSEGLVHSASDKTLYGALSKLQQVVDKRFFYGYLSVLAIGEEAAKYNLLSTLELIDRTPSIRTSAYIVFSPGKAEDILGTVDASHAELTANTLSNLMLTSASTGAAYPFTVQQFMEMISTGGLEAVGPCVNTTIKELDILGGTQDNIKANEKKEGKLRVAGMAAFKGDKLAGWLDDKESIGYGFITGKKVLAYKYSYTDSGDENVVYFRVASSKSKIKVNHTGEMPSVDISIKLTCDMRKYVTNKASDYIDPEEMQKMESKLSNSIKSDIEAALEKGQKKLQSDIFGFGFTFFRAHPKLWQKQYEKKWDKLFPDIPVKVKVTSQILNTGTNLRKLEVK